MGPEEQSCLGIESTVGRFRSGSVELGPMREGVQLCHSTGVQGDMMVVSRMGLSNGILSRFGVALSIEPFVGNAQRTQRSCCF